MADGHDFGSDEFERVIVHWDHPNTGSLEFRRAIAIAGANHVEILRLGKSRVIVPFEKIKFVECTDDAEAT